MNRAAAGVLASTTFDIGNEASTFFMGMGFVHDDSLQGVQHVADAVLTYIFPAGRPESDPLSALNPVIRSHWELMLRGGRPYPPSTFIICAIRLATLGLHFPHITPSGSTAP